jgi:3-oxoacyl-[acyl-carrier protein] reductase
MLTTETEAAQMLRTNFLGAFLVSRYALRMMKQSGFGRVIYLSSIRVPLGTEGSVIYGVSKAGLEQMAFGLAREFPNDNITFNALGISLYSSGMTAALSHTVLAQTRTALVKATPLVLEEIATAVDFFASEKARQITGQTIYFGGVR